MTGGETLLTLGKVGKTHGIKGWVRLHSFTDPVTNIGKYRHFQARLGGRLEHVEMDKLQEQGSHLVAHFRGYDAPETVQKLIGTELLVVREVLPALPEGEYYWHQLLGLRVVNVQGDLLGVLERLLETGANDVLVVQPCTDSIDDRERLIPYLRDAVVTDIDTGAGLIKVDWPADYLA